MAIRSEPTGAAPGTSEKIEVLRQRAAMGYPLFHRHDCRDYRGMKKVPVTTWQRRDEKVKETKAMEAKTEVKVTDKRTEWCGDRKDVIRITINKPGGWRCKLSCGHMRTIEPREYKPTKLACPKCRMEKR